MSKLKHALRAFLIILGVLVLSLVSLGILLVHNARDWDAFLERYHQYSPKVCYNLLPEDQVTVPLSEYLTGTVERQDLNTIWEKLRKS